LVNDESGDLLADSRNNLNRRKSYFYQLLTVHNVSDVRQIDIHTAEPRVHCPSHLEVEFAIAKLIMYKSRAEVIQAGGLIVSVIHKLINAV
jgi:hypothetical protein